MNEPKLVAWECSSLEVEHNAGNSLFPNLVVIVPRAMNIIILFKPKNKIKKSPIKSESETIISQYFFAVKRLIRL